MKIVNAKCPNTILNLPDVGKVQLDEHGIVDVPKETAELMVNNSPDWELYSTTKMKGAKTKEETLTKDKLNTANVEIDDDIEESKKVTITEEQIDNLKLDQLLSLASEMNLKGWKMLQKNEKGLKTLIKKQLFG